MQHYDCRISLIKSFPKGSVGAEIGVLKGAFSCHILEIVQPRIFYMVDCWESTKEYDGFIPPPGENLLDAARAVRDSSAKGIARIVRARSVDGAALVPDDSLDWVFIDASHLEENVWDDLQAWIPKVKLGGIVAGHDYPPPTDRNVRTCYRRTAYGVGKAVDRYVSENGIQELGITDDLPASWYFRKQA